MSLELFLLATILKFSVFLVWGASIVLCKFYDKLFHTWTLMLLAVPINAFAFFVDTSVITRIFDLTLLSMFSAMGALDVYRHKRDNRGMFVHREGCHMSKDTPEELPRE